MNGSNKWFACALSMLAGVVCTLALFPNGMSGEAVATIANLDIASEAGGAKEAVRPVVDEMRVEASSTQVAPTSEVIRTPIEPAKTPPGMLAQDEFEPEDADRMEIVNAALKKAGRMPIPASYLISKDDLGILRGWVDAAERAVNRADAALGRAQAAVLNPKSKALKERVRAGITEGLPLQGPDNPFKALEPYEAVRLSVGEGKFFVLRASPREAPELITYGRELENQVRLRAEDFDANVRSLFQPR
ncbi:MAG: hypothetical protein RL398_237 [Planctomycetota bacterium]|jgi:hypothetical protein